MDGCVISKELLMHAYYQFLSETIEKDSHNVNIVLHTGSICFDAMLLSYVAITDIFYNQNDPLEIIRSLLPGDKVVFNEERYLFKGFIRDIGTKNKGISSADIEKDGDYIVLEQNNERSVVGKKAWRKIIPYQGNASSLDGRGLRKNTGIRNLFFLNVLGVKEEEIPVLIKVSTIIVMPKDYAFKLVQGLSFRFDGQELRFTDLVNVSYFTDLKHEYPIGGNAARIEPVIKIASRVSVCRQLLLQREWNRNIGLVVLGNESYQRGSLELPELIERKSIQYIYLCMNIDCEDSNVLLSNYSHANLFACTKDFLLSHTKEIVDKNELTGILSNQIDAIIDHEITEIIIQDIIEWNDYKKFKRAIFMIKSSDYESEGKDSFIIQSFSLMNLFLSAVFPICELEQKIVDGTINNVVPPLDKIEKLEQWYREFPQYLHEPGKLIVNCLLDVYTKIYSSNPKKDVLLKELEVNEGKEICVVVPKAYHVRMVNQMINSGSVDVATVNRFDNSRIYDLIISVGCFTGKKFDIFRSKAATSIVALLYKTETHQFRMQRKRSVDVEHFLNSKSTIMVDDDLLEETSTMDPIEEHGKDEGVAEIASIDDDISVFIESSIAKTARSYSGNSNRDVAAEIIAIAKFDSDEVAFFTKNYKAYVLDRESQTAREEKVTDLTEGDTIVFTRSTSKTRDIVDTILQEMVQNQKISKELSESYRLSKLWKTKLKDYMNKNAMSPKSIAKKMIDNGAAVQEITIRGWLDEDSHTVGPRDMSSIEQIALVIGDENMLDNAEVYYQACSDIRRVRRQILEAIGNAILKKLTGNDLKKDSMLATVQEKLGSVAVVVNIETITFINESIPIHLINRPVSIGLD